MEHPASFSDFPDELQIAVLSLLSIAEISAFACTSRHFSSLCSHKSPSSRLYRSLCNRRWGLKTLIPSWTSNSPLLAKTLDRWDPLIGFWRQIGNSKGVRSLPLVLFEWGTSCITGWGVFSNEPGSYDVVKKPFLWMGMSNIGEPVSFLSVSVPESDPELVPVSVSFMEVNHVVVEESGGGSYLRLQPDQMKLEIYQFFRMSPGGDKGLKKQRRKKVKRIRWDTKHFVKIENSCPTPARPLQGLWKGFHKRMFSDSYLLDFYVVTYDDADGITCRRVEKRRYPLVFWAPNTAFLSYPFSKKEEKLYTRREHLAPDHCDDEKGVVSRILSISSSYEVVLPNLSGSSKPRNVEGRIWEYENGTFGFGFLKKNFIVDLKHVALNGTLLDTVDEYCGSSLSSCESFSSCSSISSPSP